MMRINLPATLVTILMSLCISQYSVAASAFLSGDFKVEGGQATYSLPITVAPGRGEFSPQLSLEYASDNGNGVLGVGWRLGGLSSIYRCGKNLSIDGVWGGVKFDDNDRFCIDGQHLIAITGNDGHHLTEYRTEIDNGNIIVSYKRQGKGPRYFMLWTPDGREFTYGNSNDSRFELKGKREAYKWALTSTKDKANNTITYRYNEDQELGEQSLSSVDYVGGKVKINYTSRPDIVQGYLMGSLRSITKRVSSIQSFDANGKLIGNLKPNYKDSDATKRSLITKFSYQTPREKAEPIILDWNDDAAGKITYNNKTPYGFSEVVNLYDVNRNGHKDYLYNSPTGGTTIRSTQGHKFWSNAHLLTGTWSGGREGIKHCNGNCYYAIDTNNDGIDELATKPALDINGDGKATYINKQHEDGQFQYLDINNDGKLDKFLYYSKEGNVVGGGANNPEYGREKRSGLRYTLNGEEEVELFKLYYSSLNSRRHNDSMLEKVHFTDVNGDGYADFLYKIKNENYSFRLFDGKVFLEKTYVIPNSNSKRLAFEQAVDWNRNGRNELVFSDSDTHKTRVVTFNKSDNFSDISNRYYTGRVKFYDINSDGWLDITTTAWRDGVASSVKISKTPGAVDTIKKITSADNVVSISYKPLQDSSVHKQVFHHTYPVKNITPAWYVVSSFKDHNGSNSYVYKGAKVHANGGGFLGFSDIVHTHNAAGVSTVVNAKYRQYYNVPGRKKYLNAGKLIETSTLKNNQLTEKKLFDYEVVSTKGVNNAYSYRIQKKTNKLIDYDAGKAYRTTHTSYTRNALGRVKSQTDVISGADTSIPMFIRVSTNQYLSSGVNKKSTVYRPADNGTRNIINTLKSYNGVELWCGNDGKKYLKPKDEFVLIHGDIAIPLITRRHEIYYRISEQSYSANRLSNTSFIVSRLTAVSGATFKASRPNMCGSYAVIDVDGDGRLDLSSRTKSLTTLVTEAGHAYWQTSAPTRTETVLTDKTSGLSKTTTHHYQYDAKGLLLTDTLSSSGYDGGSGTKQLVQRYSYDEYGNIRQQTTSGTGAESRTTTTEYDELGLYPKASINAMEHRTSVSFSPAFGLQTQEISPNKGRLTTWTYDDFGRVETETRPGVNNVTSYSYYMNSQCPQARSNTVWCSKAIAKDRGTTVTHFDYAGREIRNMHQSFDGRWVYVDTQWDQLGRKVRQSRPSFIRPSAALDNVPYVTFEYDVLNREIKKIEPDANGGDVVTSTRYSGLSQTVSETKNGKVVKKTITTNVMGYITYTSEPLGAFQHYVYYPDGKLKSSTDSAGNATRIRYDNLGYRTRLEDPDLGNWDYQYNIFGELEYKKDANGVITRIGYDLLGRKVTETIGKRTSTWRYDSRAKGMLDSHTSPGNSRHYYYNDAGLLSEEIMTAKGQKLKQGYSYDSYERINAETRPNGMRLEYVYNPYGYHSAVRSPLDYVDDVFSSESFREDIRKLINEALVQAQKYIDLADSYASQRDFYRRKSNKLAGQTVELHNIDLQSLGLLNGAQHFKRYCAANGVCYLESAAWVLLHDDITIPLNVGMGQYYRIDNNYSHTCSGYRHYNTALLAVSKAEVINSGAKEQTGWVLKDVDGNGSLDLVDRKYVHGVSKDAETQHEVNLTADELSLAADIADKRYRTYLELSQQLLKLAQQVSGLVDGYCQDANQLAGVHAANRGHCANGIGDDQGISQVDQLKTILTQSELNASQSDKSYVYFWQRQNTDAFDHTLAETLGNGLVNSYVHNVNTGRANVIATHWAGKVVSQRNYLKEQGKNLRYLRYQYDSWNNVTVREDLSLGLSETFTYDELDRLTSSTPLLANSSSYGAISKDFNRTFDYRYDKLGNITFKTDVGDYKYDPNHVHAVGATDGMRYSYDAVGNMDKAESIVNGKATLERTIHWTEFNKPEQITRNGHTTSFEYDANQSRFYREDSNGKQTLYFDKLYEQVIDTVSRTVQHKQYIYADGKLIALDISEYDSARKLRDRQRRYLHYDALQSVDMITDGYGLIVERRSFDPWGKARKLAWQDIDNPSTVVQFTLTNRGFTGHEHLEEVGLIHMNGRVYDQELGRFISADPIIQAPYMTNSFNRYAYVWNNPMKYVDPTGYEVAIGICISTETGKFTECKGTSPSETNGRAGGRRERSKTIEALDNQLQKHFDTLSSNVNEIGLKNFGSIVNIEGSAVRGLAKSLIRDLTFGIFYGEISSISSLNANPIDRADIETYNKRAGMSQYAIILITGRPKGSLVTKDAKAYSVVFETTLKKTSYPGKSRAKHFQESNENLLKQMEEDPQFATMMKELGVDLSITPRGLAPRKPPSGFTWHHEQVEGIMRLVPRTQHTPGSAYWNVLHPGGKGGYSIWGKE